MEKIGSPRKSLKFPDILGLASSFYRKLGAIRRPKASEVSLGKTQPQEINWHAVKAALEAQKEAERRKWELWGAYGRR